MNRFASAKSGSAASPGFSATPPAAPRASTRAPAVVRAWPDEEPKRGVAKLLAHPATPGSLVFGLTYLLVLAHQGKVLMLFYPAAALIAAVVLYRRHPVHWLAFVMWVTFLTPSVRRFADFFNGAFTQMSPIMVVPMAVTALGGIGVLRYHRVFAQRRAMPLMMVLAGVLYAFCIGVIRVGPLPAIFGMANWCLPILVAFHVLIHWRDYAELRRVMLLTFRYGALIMGLYGIYEFVIMPPWDVFWLIGSQMNSEGHPVPFGIRVASTMNSSGPFAITAMACMLYMIADAGRVRAVAACAILLALMFSSVRTAWGGLVVGLIFPLSALSMRMRMRLIGSAVLLAVFALPLLSIDQFSGPVLKRMSSFGNISEDASFADRSKFYAQFLDTALTDFAGQGIGSTGAATKLDSSSQASAYSVFDSGLMEIPFVLGWPGTLLFVGGIFWMVGRAFRCAMSIRNDRFAASSVGICFALLLMLASANMLTGLAGNLFYFAAMMPVIARRAIRHGLATQVERT
ncbi:O-antigen ligase family protein [Pararobbsia alpina]|uniref:O-antigen ligase family protein n=1 Tax=Pararobbsia alpina TaxID=621374 RepID=UPI0039A4916A